MEAHSYTKEADLSLEASYTIFPITLRQIEPFHAF